MIKNILLFPCWLLIVAMLFACSNEEAVNKSSEDYSLQQEQTSEGNNMVHEIVTISKKNEKYLIAMNDKGDEYVIDEYDKYGIRFDVGQNIGISYTERVLNEDGTYALSVVNITEEGDLKIVPKEK